MPCSLKTRKPIDQLQPDDLVAFPLWDFALDEEENDQQDETWVRPVPSDSIGRDLYALSVAADYQTASGQRIPGIVGVSTEGEIEFEWGALLYQGQYIPVPLSDDPDETSELEDVASALGMNPAQVFPLQFSLRVLLQGESTRRSGIMEGCR